MKTYLKLVLILSLFFCGNVFAQTDLAGTWQGKLAPAKDQTITIHFIITKQADGSYKAVLNSPDFGGIKNVQANKVEFKDNRLTLDVTGLSGSYSGTLAKGVITGEWRQPGGPLPLVLTRYQAPTAGSLKPLLGSWVGKIQPNPAISVTAVFRFETTKEGKIVGFLDVPDQGAKDLAVSDLALDNGQVSFKIPAAKIDYAGKLTGSTISGTFKQAGMETKLDLVRGKYVPPAPEVNIAAETMKQLLGRWSGKLKVNETVSLTVVVRFEQNAEGKIVVLMDSPDQNAKDIPVSSAAFADGKLLLKIARVMGEYTGALGDKKIEGTFTQMGKPLPLVLTKE